MRILLCCLSFKNFTGSEIYFYELATSLINLGHKVHLFSRFSGAPLTEKNKNISYENVDSVKQIKFDLVVFSHGMVMWDFIKDIECDKFTNIIHSEVLELETPVYNSKVTRYVGIRPSIVDHFKDIKCDLIYNPFDTSRFNPTKCRKRDIKNKVVLFPGSIDYLRIKPIRYLLDLSIQQNFKLMHVGRDDYSIQHKNFISFEPSWEMENFYSKYDIVSGIFLGRTSIEGLLSGKKVLQFDVDSKGEIKRVYWHKENNLEKFNRETVCNQIIQI